PVGLAARRPRLLAQPVRRAGDQSLQAGGRAKGGQGTAHRLRHAPPPDSAGSASRAGRKPAKICPRIGESPFRNVVRPTTGATPNAPPRSTLYSLPKNTSEYSRYGQAVKPG